MSDGKITQAELAELFGDEMPIEAAKLLWGSHDLLPLNEARQKLHAFAEKWKAARNPMTPDIREKAERLAVALFTDALGGAKATDLISQALLEAHNAGRAEAAKLVDEAAEKAANKADEEQLREHNVRGVPIGAYLVEIHIARANALADAATAIRSIT